MIQWLLYSLLLLKGVTDDAKPVAQTPLTVHKFCIVEGHPHRPIDSALIELTIDSIKYKAYSAADGSFSFPIGYSGKCKAVVSKESRDLITKYLTVTKTFDLHPDGKTDTFYLLTAYGCPLRLENVYFDPGQTTIRPDGAKELLKLVRFMEAYPAVVLQLDGHSDCLGSASGKMEASRQRALSSKAFLVENGISSSRITIYAYGDSRSVNDCDGRHPGKCDKEKLQENRRVEFKILAF